MTERCTLAREVAITGRGLHTGVPVRAVFQPAARDTGIRFRRVDLPGLPEIPALGPYALDVPRRTALRRAEVEVSTVEHVLAAVYALEVHDVVIALDGPEPPAGDGSARLFVDALEASGTVTHGGVVRELWLDEKLSVRAEDAVYEVRPARDLALDVRIDWAHPAIGRQHGHWTVTRDTFVRELAHARTFGFAAERAELAARGLARGASLDNAVVLGPADVINGPLRWPDEFVRHKALDLVGDLALLGARLHAAVVAERPSHFGNRALVRALLARSGARAAAHATIQRSASKGALRTWISRTS